MPRWGGPGRRERLFEKGELKYLFLDILRDKPRHGYDLIRAVDELSEGRYTASPGAVYPILQMMEDQGYVAASHADGRKTYAVTPAGEAFLDENRATVEEVRRRMRGGHDHHGPEDWVAAAHELARFGHIFGRGRPFKHLRPEAARRVAAILARARGEIEAILASELD
ncbi:MAG: transcriptional regulator, PadR family [Cyanobacteria bacterium RYN_339]|nr:transcriptional regulator, PadR family [Cyanobacteria bacterium RYN_339]